MATKRDGKQQPKVVVVRVTIAGKTYETTLDGRLVEMGVGK